MIATWMMEATDKENDGRGGITTLIYVSSGSYYPIPYVRLLSTEHGDSIGRPDA